jgi:hypothetical protein
MPLMRNHNVSLVQSTVNSPLQGISKFDFKETVRSKKMNSHQRYQGVRTQCNSPVFENENIATPQHFNRNFLSTQYVHEED